jgi:hypothetical protein
MPPQPLSKVNPRARVLWDDDTLYKHRPEFAPLAIGVIAHWSIIEAKIAGILSFVLRSEARPIMAMIRAIRSASAQMDMIESAGEVKLKDQNELEIFLATIRLARNAAKHRHPIAHHIWAFCQEMPDAILLADPQAYVDIFVAVSAVDGKSSEPDKSLIKVYRKSDFEQIIREMETTSKCVDDAMFILNGHLRVPPQIYARLLAEPLFQEAVKWLRKTRPHPTG